MAEGFRDADLRAEGVALGASEGEASEDEALGSGEGSFPLEAGPLGSGCDSRAVGVVATPG
ncbi:hypothetical protein, partial [Streptomyces sp. NPDC059411]|uniref:hypothetical protein n=1 Tax=Streptomyces sp. NPDC059411 TaxID=3346825 RepID=UPI003675CE44